MRIQPDGLKVHLLLFLWPFLLFFPLLGSTLMPLYNVDEDDVVVAAAAAADDDDLLNNAHSCSCPLRIICLFFENNQPLILIIFSLSLSLSPFADHGSNGDLQLVRMQYASFLHCQRSSRGMRATRTSIARLEIPGAETARLRTAALLSGRGQEPVTRGVRADMSALCQTGNARHRAIRTGRALR